MSDVKIPLMRFFPHVAKTHDEVYFGILRAQHRAEKHTITEWRAILESYRTRPVAQEH